MYVFLVVFAVFGLVSFLSAIVFPMFRLLLLLSFRFLVVFSAVVFPIACLVRDRLSDLRFFLLSSFRLPYVYVIVFPILRFRCYRLSDSLRLIVS